MVNKLDSDIQTVAQLENSLTDPNNGDGLGNDLSQALKDEELEGDKQRIQKALSQTQERIKKFTADEKQRQDKANKESLEGKTDDMFNYNKRSTEEKSDFQAFLSG